MRKGFTIIELLVVLGVIALTVPAMFSILFTVMQQQVKVLRTSEVKRQGDFIINQIGTIIRTNAREVYSESAFTNKKCYDTSSNSTYTSTDGTAFFFKDAASNYFQFTNSGGTMVINATSGSTYPQGNMSSRKVRVENFTIKCTKTANYAPALITVSFTLCYSGSPSAACSSVSRIEEVASVDFNSSIQIRNQ